MYLTPIGKHDPYAHLRYGVYNPPNKIGFKDLLKEWRTEWKHIEVSNKKDLTDAQNVRESIKNLLNYAYEFYQEDSEYEEDYVPEVIDDIREHLDELPDSHLEFVLTWPYVKEKVDDLALALDNGDYFSECLWDLNENIDLALKAMNAGIYIPGTSSIVVSKGQYQITDEQFKVLNNAIRYVKDSSCGEAQSPAFIDLSPLGDINAETVTHAWFDSRLKLTKFNWKPRIYITDEVNSSIACFHRHENGHHDWWKGLSERDIVHDNSFELENEARTTSQLNPSNWLQEVREHTDDVFFAAEQFGKRGLDRYDIEWKEHALHDLEQLESSITRRIIKSKSIITWIKYSNSSNH